MHIAYLDGERLKRALIAGSRRLIERAAHLNAINVFPVPDGDTGTNMAGTARTMVMGLRSSPSLSLGAAMRTAADSALIGARGNSGAIFAQFLHGLAEELQHEMRISTRRFGAAVKVAALRCYRALSKPREGTILTVLKDWAEAAQRLGGKTDDFLVLMRGSLEEAKASLARTTELLPELKKAGVVDAGAEGMVSLLEGIVSFIRGGHIRDLKERSGADRSGVEDEEPAPVEALPAETEEGSGFRYCTECLVVGSDLDLDILRSRLETQGDSIVVAGSGTRAKVHLHTDAPAAAFRLLESAGEIEGQKVDDMELQRRLARRSRLKCAVLTDSGCDVPDDIRLELGIERVPIQVQVGNRSYLDRDALGADEFFAMLAAEGRTGKALGLSTSQPTPASFARKLDILLGHAEEVVYIGISGALSGTLDAGRRAAAMGARAGRVSVVDSRSVSVGAALVIRRAAEAAAAGSSAAEVAALAQGLVRRSRLLIAVPDLAGLVRSGRLRGIKGLAARSLGIHPLITIDTEGAATAAGVYLGAGNGVKALLAAMRRMVPKGCRTEVMVGHVAAAAEAAALVREIEGHFDLEREVLVTPVSPALAAHAGLGGLALGFLVPQT